MPHSPVRVRNRQIETMQRRRERSGARRALMWLAGLTLGLACVDLTPPPEVVNFRNGIVSGTGGQLPVETGGAGGLPGSGGSVIGGTSGSGGATGPGGATGVGGLTGAGGAVGRGGSTIPTTGSGGIGHDAGLPDVAEGTGGATGTGGAVGLDGGTGTGGTTGTGGKRDGAAGAGGSQPDVPVGSGGVTGTGGITAGSGGRTGSGGAPGTGGATVGTGGGPGTGGAVGTGGSTGYGNCASPVVPANGVVTNFTDWNSSTNRWGSGNLIGTIYAYAASGSTMNTAKVEGSPPGLHLSGSLASGSSGWGGGGLTFLSCVTVASFTRISFDVYGQASGCSIELQLQTFNQRPTDQDPPGGCVKAADGSGCFGFPLKSQVVDLATAVTTPRTVSVTLNTMTSWAASAATQLVGMQWQFASTGGTCTPNATFTNIKFVP